MSNESITITQSINSVTVAAVGSVGLNAGGLIQGNLEVDGNVVIDGLLTVGADTDGKDVRFWGETASKYTLWDASQDKLIITGDLQVDGTTTTINSTVVTIEDPVFTLGGATAPTTSDSKDRGIEFHYYDTDASAGKKGFFGWGNSDNAIKFLLNCADPSGSEIFTGDLAEVHMGALGIYSDLDDPAGNYERGSFAMDTSGDLTIGTEAGGTGTAGDLKLSPAGDLILNAGGGETVEIGSNGNISFPYGGGNAAITSGSGYGIYLYGGGVSFLYQLKLWSNIQIGGLYGFDAILEADAAGILAQRNIGVAQEYRIYSDLADPAGNYERGSFAMNTSGDLTIRTQAGGTGTAGDINLIAGRVEVTASTAFDLLGPVGIGSSSLVSFSQYYNPATGPADVSLSRISAGTLGVGTGAIGEVDGTLIAESIGIGTSSPATTLEVEGNLTLSSTFPHLYFAEEGAPTDESRWELSGNAGELNWDVANDGGGGQNTWLNVTRTGTTVDEINLMATAVGIGTDSPAKPLEVKNAEAVLRLYSTSGRQYDLVSGGGVSTIANDFAIINQGDGGTAFRIKGGSNSDGALTIDDGNVGIGTASPLAKIHCESTTLPQARIAYDASNYMLLQSTSAGTISAMTKDSAVVFTGTKSGSQLQVGQNFSKTILGEAGNVGINKASPSYRLDVKESAANTYVARLYNDGNHQNRDVLLLQGGDDSHLGTTKFITLADGDGTETAWIQGAADGANGGVAINTTAAEAGDFVIDESGNVGIGTTSPGSLLHCGGNSASDGGSITLSNSNSGTSSYNEIIFKTIGDQDSVLRSAASLRCIYVDHVGTNPSGELAFSTKDDNGNLLERQRIDSDGNVGINETSPTHLLHLSAGEICVDRTTEDAAFFNYKATADADTTSAISTLTTSGATTHHIQVDINGTKAWIAVSTNNPS